MKHLAKSLVVAGAVLAAGSASAGMMGDISPYIGIDYQQSWMKGNGDWRKVFPDNYKGASLYVGTKFHEYFGLELGYDWSAREKENLNLAAGSTLFGNTLTAAATGTAKVRRTGGHLDLVGFLPVADNFELTASLGYGWIQPKVEMTINNPAANVNNSALASVSGKGKSVFRVGVGGSYMLTDMVGLRARLGWESTSSLRLKGNTDFTNGRYDTKGFKGTTSLRVGAFVKF